MLGFANPELLATVTQLCLCIDKIRNVYYVLIKLHRTHLTLNPAKSCSTRSSCMTFMRQSETINKA